MIELHKINDNEKLYNCCIIDYLSISNYLKLHESNRHEIFNKINDNIYKLKLKIMHISYYTWNISMK